MLSEVRAAGGVFDNWGGSGLVVTLLSGGSIPGLDFPIDAMALLGAPSADPSTWRMRACNQRTELPFVRRRGQWVQVASRDGPGGAAGATGGAEVEWMLNAVVQRACNPGIASFVCLEKPWRAGGVAGASIY